MRFSQPELPEDSTDRCFDCSSVTTSRPAIQRWRGRRRRVAGFDLARGEIFARWDQRRRGDGVTSLRRKDACAGAEPVVDALIEIGGGQHKETRACCGLVKPGENEVTYVAPLARALRSPPPSVLRESAGRCSDERVTALLPFVLRDAGPVDPGGLTPLVEGRTSGPAKPALRGHVGLIASEHQRRALGAMWRLRGSVRTSLNRSASVPGSRGRGWCRQVVRTALRRSRCGWYRAVVLLRRHLV